MRPVKGALLVFAVVVTAAAQSADPPLSDSRLAVHTLVREDLFAGFLDNNMARFERGERNIDALLTHARLRRPTCWRGKAARPCIAP